MYAYANAAEAQLLRDVTSLLSPHKTSTESVTDLLFVPELIHVPSRFCDSMATLSKTPYRCEHCDTKSSLGTKGGCNQERIFPARRQIFPQFPHKDP